MRVAIEHTFGILKGCWNILCNLPMKLYRNKTKCHIYIVVCAILPNLLVNTDSDYIPPQPEPKAHNADNLEYRQATQRADTARAWRQAVLVKQTKDIWQEEEGEQYNPADCSVINAYTAEL